MHAADICISFVSVKGQCDGLCQWLILEMQAGFRKAFRMFLRHISSDVRGELQGNRLTGRLVLFSSWRNMSLSQIKSTDISSALLFPTACLAEHVVHLRPKKTSRGSYKAEEENVPCSVTDGTTERSQHHALLRKCQIEFVGGSQVC